MQVYIVADVPPERCRCTTEQGTAGVWIRRSRARDCRFVWWSARTAQTRLILLLFAISVLLWNCMQLWWCFVAVVALLVAMMGYWPKSICGFIVISVRIVVAQIVWVPCFCCDLLSTVVNLKIMHFKLLLSCYSLPAVSHTNWISISFYLVVYSFNYCTCSCYVLRV